LLADPAARHPLWVMRSSAAALMIVTPPEAPPRRREERTGIVGEKRLVISSFDAEADADEAAAALQRTGAVVDDAIGVLALDRHGELKTNKVGATSGGKGAAAGGLLGLLGPIGFGVGAVGGALLGKLHHKDLGLDDADRERLGAALRGGRAAGRRAR
jgi:uncharacterized membrane protein